MYLDDWHCFELFKKYGMIVADGFALQTVHDIPSSHSYNITL